MSRCTDCDGKLTAANSVSAGPGRPARNQCRGCFNRRQEGYKDYPRGGPPGRPPKGTSAAPDARREHAMKQRLDALASTNKGLLADLQARDAVGDLREAARKAREKVKPIEAREVKSGLREAVGLALASDWHIEERVLPEQVAMRNKYDLTVSKRRMERFFASVRWALDFNRQAFKIRKLVLWLGGDLISGHIHPDLQETNYLSPPRALAFGQANISAGIRQLLEDDKLEELVIVCNDGNHGRLTHKMRAAARTDQSLEWLLYTWLAQDFADEPRTRWLVAEGPHEYLPVYGRTIRFLHGDGINFQGGIGGPTVPILRALGRMQSVRQAHLTCMGHFHQYMSLPELVVNGSLIGYNAYAMSKGLPFEAPCQAFRVLDPLRFNSVAVPLWVSDRADDAG